MQKLHILILLLLPVFASTHAADTPHDIRSIIEEQAEMIKLLTARVDSLERQLQLSDYELSPSPVTDNPATIETKNTISKSSIVNIKWNGAPELSNVGDSFTFKPRGRIHTDAWTSNSKIGDVDYPSGFELRRVHIGVQGTLPGKFSYISELALAGNKISYEDIYIKYGLLTNLSVLIGHHKASVSLEDETSDNDVIFLERDVYNAFSPGRALGVALSQRGTSWSLKAGIYGDPENNNSDQGIDEGWRTSIRGTFAPLHSNKQVFHLGGSFYKLFLSKDNPTFAVDARPASHLLPSLFRTGTKDAKDISFFGLETAVVVNSWSAQAEWGHQVIDYTLLPTAEFDGGYISFSWIPTGESRPYDAGAGKFKRIIPKLSIAQGGLGAFELAFKYSYLDLVDETVFGGLGNLWTVGINWYPVNHIRLMANWVYFNIENSATSFPLGSVKHVGNAFGMRMQVDW